MKKTTWGSVARFSYGRSLPPDAKRDGTSQIFGTNGPTGWTGACMGTGPTVVIGRKGAYRGVHLASKAFWVIDTAFYMEPGPTINPIWAYYCLKQYDINAMDAGSAIPSTRRQDLEALPLDLPDLATQTAIADVLGALDDKIAANERMLELNLRLRSAIFESLAKPLSVPMSDLARFVNGRNFTKDATGSGRPVIRIAELNNGITSSTVWNEVLAADDNLGRAGDILFAWSGSLTVTRWTGAEGLVNQHIFKVLTSGLPDWVVYHVLLDKLTDYKSIAADKATTMGHIQRGHLDQPVPTPTLEEVARVDGTMSALWSAELSLRIENSRLAATRNALLPELMSGRLTVGGVQQGPS